ncbi:MAG: hypothetical protein HOQ24_11445, partial [Mycobacteriaceae bacterium]|nr:hypothetical protein [Mycobacteriaceae bacterium]
MLTLLLRRARLITLLGAGGIGKTALAAEAVARYRASTGATVHWVGLARLQAGADESAVLDEIAQVVLEADAAEACTTRQAVVNALEQANPTGHGPETILVLDNCEHVAAAAGQVIADVLAAVGSVCVLATSRRPIGWVDEHRVAVPPLSCADAVELFRRRALLAGKPLPESDYEESVAAICRRLHNHPLYLRLAAARLVRQPLATILSDLATEPEADRRLAWTTSATIGVDARHHGVGDAIGWSYRLCSDVERLLFERMSVFAAGYDIDNRSVTPESGVELEAVEQVCADQEGRPGGGLTRDTVEEVLHGLADQSLVTVHWSPTVVRYSLVESLRVYARQRLRERGSDEITNVTESYVRYYRSRVAGVAAGWCGPDGAAMLQWAQQAWPNIRTAVELAAAEPDTAEVGLEMCALLFESRIAYLKGGFRATKLMTERALHVCGARPTPLRQRTIAKLALMAVYAGELDNAEELLGRCVLDAAADMPPARWQDSPHLDLGLSAAAEFAWGNLLLSGRDARAGMVFQRAAAKFTAAGAAGPAIQAALVAT